MNESQVLPDPFQAGEEPSRRTRVSQSDVPSVTLEQAARIPRAIAESYAKQPATPVQVGVALDMKPTTGRFRTLCGAALGYGLTDGGPFAKRIGLTDLGRRLVSPLEEGDDEAALREAVMVPTVERELLERYSGSRLPPRHIVNNVLEEMGVPLQAAERVYDVIIENARSAGFTREIKGDLYVDLSSRLDSSHAAAVEGALESPAAVSEPRGSVEPSDVGRMSDASSATKPTSEQPPAALVTQQVYIACAQPATLLEQIEAVVEACGFDHVVAAEERPSSQAEMQDEVEAFRRCSAGIIRVSQPELVTDRAGQVHFLFDPDELIQLGRAGAQFGSKIAVLVDEATELPQSLRFAHQVQMSGDELETFGLMTLLRALSEFRQEQPSSGDAG